MNCCRPDILNFYMKLLRRIEFCLNYSTGYSIRNILIAANRKFKIIDFSHAPFMESFADKDQ